MKLLSEELKRAILSKTNEELYDVVYVHSTDYTPEALEIAKREFIARGVDAHTLTQLSSAADLRQEHEQAQEQAPLEGYLKVVAFFFSTMFLGIPVLLAYNYYYERGARRKAREWVRWAAGGFFFFFIVSRSIGIAWAYCFPALNRRFPSLRRRLVRSEAEHVKKPPTSSASATSAAIYRGSVENKCSLGSILNPVWIYALRAALARAIRVFHAT
jgi:hypothetical protein